MDSGIRGNSGRIEAKNGGIKAKNGGIAEKNSKNGKRKSRNSCWHNFCYNIRMIGFSQRAHRVSGSL